MSHSVCYKMSFLVKSHIMWDTNIKIVVFSKYAGGGAGRSIVEEEIPFMAKLSIFSKGNIFFSFQDG